MSVRAALEALPGVAVVNGAVVGGDITGTVGGGRKRKGRHDDVGVLAVGVCCERPGGLGEFGLDLLDMRKLR